MTTSHRVGKLYIQPLDFILPGSRPVTKIGNLRRFLENRLKVPIPSCTRARKLGVTEAVHHLGEVSNTLISAQMSHSGSVAKKYYQAVTGTKDAAIYRFQVPRGTSNWKNTTTITTTTQSPNAKSKSWTEEETTYVHCHKVISKKGNVPPMKDCAAKARDIKGKTPKQIQDKVRMLIWQQIKMEEACISSSESDEY